LAGQLAGTLSRFSATPLRYQTPAGQKVEVDLRGLVVEIAGRAACVDSTSLRSALLADDSLASRILHRMARELPQTTVLVIDQAEEIFTLHQGREDDIARAWALEALGCLAGGSGGYKVIVSMRTEYFGRLISTLRKGATEVRGVREYFLTDFGESALVEAIRRPTQEVRIRYTSEIPYQRYRFRYYR